MKSSVQKLEQYLWAYKITPSPLPSLIMWYEKIRPTTVEKWNYWSQKSAFVLEFNITLSFQSPKSSKSSKQNHRKQQKSQKNNGKMTHLDLCLRLTPCEETNHRRDQARVMGSYKENNRKTE